MPADDLAETVTALATRLAAGPTVAFAAIRQSVGILVADSFADSLANEGEMMNRTGGTEDHLAAVAAFVAKEKPVFHGR